MFFNYLLLIKYLKIFNIKDKSENIYSNLQLNFNNEFELKNWLIINGGINEQQINNLILKLKYFLNNKKIFYNFGMHHPNPEKLKKASEAVPIYQRPGSPELKASIGNPEYLMRTALLQSSLVNIINNGNGKFTLKFGKVVSTLNFYSMGAVPLFVIDSMYWPQQIPVYFWRELEGSELDTIYNDCKQRFDKLIPQLSHILN